MYKKLLQGIFYLINLKNLVQGGTKDRQPVHAMNQYLVDWINKTAVANIHFMNGVD
tara:strand:+ start:429 stop:596 length:168 start_codon:yes stop_codon:yes gene_type:complete